MHRAVAERNVRSGSMDSMLSVGLWRSNCPGSPAGNPSLNCRSGASLKRTSLTPYHGTECILHPEEVNLTTYTIGKLAERTDVSVETIRYYERRGLLERPSQPSSGYRLYTDEAHRRLSFIRKAKALGFTLGEIGELLELSTDSPDACGQVEIAATLCAERIDAQVRALRQMKRALEALVARCGADHAEGACPIIEALEEAESENDAD